MGAALRSASYSVPQDIRATFARLLAYMGCLAILAVVAAIYFQPLTSIAAIEATPRPAWTNVERPYPAFELLMPELAGSTFNYAILRRPSDGARKDVLSWGDATGAGPYVMVEVLRPGAVGERFLDAPSEIAARIIGYTVTDDVKPAGQIDSKFGAVPLVDFAVAPHGKERRCLGFARPLGNPAMQIAGWYCSAGQEVVDRATLGCVLDRLTLSAGGDPHIDEVFAHAEIKRSFCGQRSPILAATPEREQPIAPPAGAQLKTMLRGRISQH
jgi:hypothetical protein